MRCKVQTNINQKLLPSQVKYFKEEIINEILTIISEKPNIERILNVVVDPKIVSMKLIETEEGYSNEGQRLAGYKLIIELNIKEKITYVADEKTQSVHVAYFENMKSLFIVLPKEINCINTCELFRSNRIFVTPYVEAVKARKLDCRNIHKCILLLVNAIIC
ncbi:hypothetical protein [Clostridium weizhouense]|uniref:Uncharacterized protein n=1 Tax=Clostridium weizhouense TaxID=2859781 RepID=A0ABS7ARL2_9CLOT|nr:hypothetical protein [Clostridium weizhouense]MBW6410130.1 hypothetical protein [Clostridium weizhouense]